MRQVWKAGIIVAAIFLIQKTAMQLISINYHRKQYGEYAIDEVWRKASS